MKNKGFWLFNIEGAALVICVILSMFGMVGTANAECKVDESADSSSFSLLIDATSSCSNISNMEGCEISSGASTCTIKHPSDSNQDILVTIDPAVGSTASINWSSSSLEDKLVDFVIAVAQPVAELWHQLRPGADGVLGSAS